jgi:hypothetical protein
MVGNITAENKNNQVPAKIKQNAGVDPKHGILRKALKHQLLDYKIEQEKAVTGKNKALRCHGIMIGTLETILVCQYKSRDNECRDEEINNKGVEVGTQEHTVKYAYERKLKQCINKIHYYHPHVHDQEHPRDYFYNSAYNKQPEQWH